MKNLVASKLASFFDIGLRREISVNLARKKFMIGFVIGILLSKNVAFTALAEHLNPDAELESNTRRIQRFFKDVQLDYLQIATILLCFLPPGRLSISVDRTNWQVAGQDVNILTVTAWCKGVGVPLFFELLDKKGNSNTKERQLLLRRLFRLLPPRQIAAFCADREFIGEEWYKFLIKKQVPFYIRIKSNHLVTLNGVIFKSKHLALPGEKRLYSNIGIHGLQLHLAAKLIGHEKDEEEKYLLVLTNAQVGKALDIYRQRWSIEVFFQSLKKRGFNLENTHLDELVKLKKLFAFVCLAFACCLKIGIWKQECIKPMKKKKNGYKPNSFFRYGLNEIRGALLHLEKRAERFAQIVKELLQGLIDNLDGWSTLNFILRL